MPAAAFAQEFSLVDSVALEQADSAVIARISGIDVDDSGRILIGDVSEGNVKLFASDGRLLRILGRKGGGPGEFSAPRYPRFGADGLIYVADAQTGRIQVFDSEGTLRRLTRMQDVGLITGFQPLPDKTYLVAAEIGEDPHVVVRIDTAGRVVQRFLAIRNTRPTAQPDHELWRNVRNFFMDVAGDTVYVTSTISDSVWTVHLPSGTEGRVRLRFPGYVAPSTPQKMPEDIPALMEWGSRFHSGSTLSIDGGSVYLPYVQGVLNNGDPMLLVNRSQSGRWSVLEGAPPVIGAANGRAVAILNPGEDQIRLGFFVRASR